MNRSEVDFSKEKQTRGNPDAKSLSAMGTDKKFNKLGEGKGLIFTFREDEVVHFPKPEECYPIPKKFGDTIVLYITGYSESRQRMVDIPAATFRRIPATEEEIDDFYDPSKHPLNVELAELTYDIQRITRLCEIGTIRCSTVVPAHKAVLKQLENGK